MPNLLKIDGRAFQLKENDLLIISFELCMNCFIGTKSREVAQCCEIFLVIKVAGIYSRAKIQNKKSWEFKVAQKLKTKTRGDLLSRKKSKQKVAGV